MTKPMFGPPPYVLWEPTCFLSSSLDSCKAGDEGCPHWLHNHVRVDALPQPLCVSLQDGGRLQCSRTAAEIKRLMRLSCTCKLSCKCMLLTAARKKVLPSGLPALLFNQSQAAEIP